MLVVAPVLVASVFGSAVIKAGSFSTSQFEQVAYSAVRDTSTGIELRGPSYARTDGTAITHVLLDVDTIPGGLPVDLSRAAASEGTVVSYVSASALAHSLSYEVHWITGNGDSLLESGELAEIDVDVSGVAAAGEAFTIEIRPAHGLYATVHVPAQPAGHLATVLTLN
jgi:archaellin